MSAIHVYDYFKLGFGVVPVKFGEKKPILKSWQTSYFQTKEDYDMWRKDKANHNIGIVTGKASNILVIDIDKAKNNTERDGEESLTELIKQLGELPSTVEQQTRSGARQLFFKYPKNVDRITGTVKVVDCIDIRADDNQVVVFPSVYEENGIITGKWTWINPPGTHQIAELPQTWVDFIVQNTGNNNTQKKHNRAMKIKEVNKAKTFDEGSRNDQLFKYLRGLINVKTLRNEEALFPVALYYNQIKCNPPLAEDEIRNIVSSVLNYKAPHYINEKGKVIPYLLTDFILQNNVIVHSKGIFYKYNGIHYEAIDKETNLSEFIEEIMESEGKEEQITSKLKTEVCFHAQSKCNVPSFDNVRGYINFKNGILDVANKTMLPHTSKYYTLGCYNANYEPTKANIQGTAWDKYLNTTFDEDMIPLIQELIGVCLYPITDKAQACFFLIGNGSNGKSVLMQTITKIVPLGLRSGISAEDYDKRFINSSIKGKTVNINMDDPTVCIETGGNFKKVTAGDEIAVEFKHKDVEIINPILTHISSFNTMPVIRDKTDGFYRRLITIPFTKKFGSIEEFEQGLCDHIKDKSLLDKIEAELDIITAWGIEGLYRVIENDYGFSETKATKNLKADYRLRNDTIAMWVKECVVKHTTIKNADCLKTVILYNAYKDWCSHNGYSLVMRSRFDDRIKELLKEYQHSVHGTIVWKVSFKGFNQND